MKLAFAATMIRPRYFPDSIVVQLASVSAFLHSLGHLRTCSGGKSLVCFYLDSGPNLSKAGGYTWSNREVAALLFAQWNEAGYRRTS
jgi:hypothetical protein